MHRYLPLLGALLLAACTEHHAPPRSDTVRTVQRTAPDTAPWTVSLSAYGPIRSGSSRADVLAALGAPTQRGRVSPPASCEYLSIPDSPLARDIRLMVVDDTIVRFDVDSPPVATMWGDRVGDSERAVVARHAGDVRIQPHKYTGPKGHYVVVTSQDDTLHRLVFETDGQRVLAYHAGLRPYVDWVEGCS